VEVSGKKRRLEPMSMTTPSSTDEEAAAWLFLTAPDGGGIEEGSLFPEKRLRRERGLGVTYYEWRFGSAGGRHGILVPLPSGVRTFSATSCLYPLRLLFLSASNFA
jgi:hypothetical protein